MDATSMKDEWKYTTMDSGAQSVVITGRRLMLKLFAENWDFLELLQLMVVLILVEELVLFGWMLLIVTVTSLILTVAFLITGELMIVTIVKMPV
jgi:hypothetical protein